MLLNRYLVDGDYQSNTDFSLSLTALQNRGGGIVIESKIMEMEKKSMQIVL